MAAVSVSMELFPACCVYFNISDKSRHFVIRRSSIMGFSKLTSGFKDRLQRFFTSATTLEIISQGVSEVLSDRTHTSPVGKVVTSLAPLSFLPNLCPLCFTSWLIARLTGSDDTCDVTADCPARQKRGSGGQIRADRKHAHGDCAVSAAVQDVAVREPRFGVASRFVPVSVRQDEARTGCQSWNATGIDESKRRFEVLFGGFVTSRGGYRSWVTSSGRHQKSLRTCALGPPSSGSEFTTCAIASRGNEIPPPRFDNFQWKWVNRGDVRTLRVIGGGTFGDVIVARYMNKVVIVKSFKASDDDHTDVTDVMYEADIGVYMASLGVGPPMVGLLQPPADTERPLPGIIWDLLPQNRTLVDVIRNINTYSISDVLNMFSQIARLLRTMHMESFLHNDIKPNNIIITTNLAYHGKPPRGPPAPRGATAGLSSLHKYRVYLIDFGNATYGEGFEYAMTDSESEDHRKFPYLAPEVVRGEQTTIKSDVFSFGMLMKLTSQFYYDPQITYQVDPLVNECTRRDPAKRPNMAEVEHQLVRSEYNFL